MKSVFFARECIYSMSNLGTKHKATGHIMFDEKLRCPIQG